MYLTRDCDGDAFSTRRGEAVVVVQRSWQSKGDGFGVGESWKLVSANLLRMLKLVIKTSNEIEQ
jgi:hypothetical protein